MLVPQVLWMLFCCVCDIYKLKWKSKYIAHCIMNEVSYIPTKLIGWYVSCSVKLLLWYIIQYTPKTEDVIVHEEVLPISRMYVHYAYGRGDNRIVVDIIYNDIQHLTCHASCEIAKWWFSQIGFIRSFTIGYITH